MRLFTLLSVFILALLLTCPALAQRTCVTQEYLAEQTKISGNVYGNDLIEKVVAGENRGIDSIGASFPKPVSLNRPPVISTGNPLAKYPLVIIPVVVHVVYRNEIQNISNQQIESQIEALNKDYRRLNQDAIYTPGAFSSLAADAFIEFRLATTDPSGFATTGIVRKKTSIEYFGVDDRIKSSAIGGDDAWDRDKYLNIWVCNLGGGVIGYSSLPGNPAEKDGVVIRWNAFGVNGSAAAPFHKGRTSTHEIGHWLGLRHIWGDTYRGDDHIDDTPPQQSSTKGCPGGTVISCSNTEGNMYMNYMDFTNDACTNMFTHGQAARMHELFAEGGSRHLLVASDGATASPMPAPIENGSLVTDGLKLYPNPVVTGQLTITVVNPQAVKTTISIYNHLGQLVKHFTSVQQSLQVNLTSLRPGAYFVSAGDKKKSYKVIKM